MRRNLTNCAVVESWTIRLNASSAHLRSKSGILYSYNKVIGNYRNGNWKLFDYSWKKQSSISTTTGSHVSLVRKDFSFTLERYVDCFSSDCINIAYCNHSVCPIGCTGLAVNFHNDHKNTFPITGNLLDLTEFLGVFTESFIEAYEKCPYKIIDPRTLK